MILASLWHVFTSTKSRKQLAPLSRTPFLNHDLDRNDKSKISYNFWHPFDTASVSNENKKQLAPLSRTLFLNQDSRWKWQILDFWQFLHPFDP